MDKEMQEIADQVIDAILAGAQKAVAQAQLDIEQLTGAAADEARKAVEGAAGEAEKALEGANEAGKEAGDAVRDLIEGIGR